MFYETIFETGRNSVAEYANDEEALAAARAHHLRAINGLRGFESVDTSPPAERIIELHKYSRHPNDLNLDQTMSADVLIKQVTALIKSLSDDNGVVAVDRLATEVRGLTHPMVTSPGPHDSIFLMEEDDVLYLGEWDGEKWLP